MSLSLPRETAMESYSVRHQRPLIVVFSFLIDSSRFFYFSACAVHLVYSWSARSSPSWIQSRRFWLRFVSVNHQNLRRIYRYIRLRSKLQISIAFHIILYQRKEFALRFQSSKRSLCDLCVLNSALVFVWHADLKKYTEFEFWIILCSVDQALIFDLVITSDPKKYWQWRKLSTRMW